MFRSNTDTLFPVAGGLKINIFAYCQGVWPMLFLYCKI